MTAPLWARAALALWVLGFGICLVIARIPKRITVPASRRLPPPPRSSS